MRNLVESCPGFADALKLFVKTLEDQFAEDTDVPAELGEALVALHEATDKLEALDSACA